MDWTLGKTVYKVESETIVEKVIGCIKYHYNKDDLPVVDIWFFDPGETRDEDDIYPYKDLLLGTLEIPQIGSRYFLNKKDAVDQLIKNAEINKAGYIKRYDDLIAKIKEKYAND